MKSNEIILDDIVDLSIGDHLCCIYTKEEEHRLILTPFIRQGLERNEKVLYVVDAHTAKQILDYLREDGMEVETYLDRGQLKILTSNESYLKEGSFDPDAMIALLLEETQQALEEGYTALRVTGEMSWALRGLPGSERLIEYETKLNLFFDHHPALAICQYDRRRFEPETLLNAVLKTHPWTVIGTEIYQNMYYIPPDEMLGESPKQSQLDRWINNLDAWKRTEETLREKEYETNQMLDQMMNAFVLYESVFDEDGELVDCRYVYVNKAYERIVGVKNDQVKGKTVHEVWPGTEPEWIKRYGEVAVSGASQAFELYHNPTKKLYHCQAYRPFDTPEKFCVIFEDISEQKAAEQALLKSEQRYRSLFENVPIGLYRTTQEGQILDANQALVDMLGYSDREMLLATSVFDLYVDPDDRKVDQFSPQDVDDVYVDEIQLQQENGDVIWAQDSVRVSHDPVDDKLYYEGSLENITEQVKAERAIKKRVSQLALLNDIGAKIAGTLDLDALLEKTVHLVQENFDYHHVSIFKLDSEGQTFVMRAGAGDIAHFYPPGHSLKLGQGVVGWVGQQGEKLLVNDVNAEPRYVNKYPDQILTQSELSVPIKIGANVVGVLDLQSDRRHAFDQNDVLVMEAVADQIAVAIENARLYQAEQAMRQNLEDLVEERTQALRDAQEQLIRKERLAALGQLAGGIAHELRQPLSTISNVAFLLKSTKTNPDEETAKHMAMLDDEVHHANHIITDLLEFARTGEAKPTSIPVENLVKRVFEKHPPPDGLTTEINIPDDLPLALIDPGHLNQVLANLVTNAYQAMPEGGQLSVESGPRTVGSVWIEVSDTGIGIPPENLEKIFEPLFTTKQRGIGLGLAISKMLVEANNGRIEVESRVGEGTTFRIVLPIVREQ